MATRLFVYGTLRTGEVRHGLLAPGGVLTIVPAVTGGRLLDLGEYPGLVGASGDAAPEQVTGELMELEDFGAIEAALDEEEGPDFERRLVLCRESASGREYEAWCYIFTGASEGASRIVSGDWVRRGEGGRLRQAGG